MGAWKKAVLVDFVTNEDWPEWNKDTQELIL